EPADPRSGGQIGRGAIYELLVVESHKARTRLLEAQGTLVIVVAGSEIAPLHAIELVVEVARLRGVQVVRCECRSERAPGIAGRRLDPDPLNPAVPQHLAVRNAVERNSPGET